MSASSRPGEDRMGGFKNKGKDTERLRGKRRDFAIELRKDRRRDAHNRMRNITEAELAEEKSAAEQIRELGPVIMDDTSPGQFDAIKRLRQLLANGTELPIQAAIDCDVLPKMVALLDRRDNPDLQYECAWVLTNIASGTREQTMTVVEANALPPLMDLLTGPNLKIADQAAWCIGNIVGDGAQMRDHLTQLGALDAFLQIMNTTNDLKFLRNAAWAVSNFFRWKNPALSLEHVEKALPVIENRCQSQDMETASNSLWALCYIVEAHESMIDRVLTVFGPRLMELVAAKDHDAKLPAIRTFGSLTAGTHDQTQRALGLGLLSNIHVCLSHDKASIRKDACWTLSNICAGTADQVLQVIEANIVPVLAKLGCMDQSLKVRVDAVWAMCNIVAHKVPDWTNYVVQNGGFVAMIGCLSVDVEARGVITVCEAVYNILLQYVSEPSVFQLFEQFNGIDRLLELVDNDNVEVASAAAIVLDHFFNDEQQEVGELAPQVAEDGTFQFGLANTDAQEPQGGSEGAGKFSF